MDDKSWQYVLLTVTIPAVVSAITTLVGLYFKHTVDMSQYNQIRQNTDSKTAAVAQEARDTAAEVKAELKNGLKSAVDANQDILVKIDQKLGDDGGGKGC